MLHYCCILVSRLQCRPRGEIREVQSFVGAFKKVTAQAPCCKQHRAFTRIVLDQDVALSIVATASQSAETARENQRGRTPR